MSGLVRRLPWPGKGERAWETLLAREWLVTNGLGGYASGTVCGVPTRRFHGLLVAALPGPHGRTMMLNHLLETVAAGGRPETALSGEEYDTRPDALPGSDLLAEFRLEGSRPVWTYEVGGAVIAKRLLLPHGQNTVHVGYRLLRAPQAVTLRLRPAVHFRPHEGGLDTPRPDSYALTMRGERLEIDAGGALPPLRLVLRGAELLFVCRPRVFPEVVFQVERSRGYDSRGGLWSPGYFEVELEEGAEATLVASAESWETVEALTPGEARALEDERMAGLLAQAGVGDDEVAAGLVLAADQFLIQPVGRAQDAARARAAGDDMRTVIAGYHWFTDWGRDTMISLEGLTLATGRPAEARWLLRTFAHYARDGLIPNLFPEGGQEGLYHTADASLWFFQAAARYLAHTGDRATLRALLPVLLDIVGHHLRGTRFGIGVDGADGLLRQGAEGHALTWMDAKVGDWVVTPRRGKAVEINALWYNALRLAQGWLDEEGRAAEADALGAHAARARRAFNDRFWYEEGRHLYDVVDGEAGDDPACRPNQILSFALTHPVLDASRWPAVLESVESRLLTPVGLRSLAPGQADYKARYYGDLRARDAAYHQGTVWAWLVGPFVDAWVRVHPQRRPEARRFLEGFVPHLGQACVGQISEVFDAEVPYTPRGCVAQAWSVAEVLRCWRLVRAPYSSSRAKTSAAREAASTVTTDSRASPPLPTSTRTKPEASRANRVSLVQAARDRWPK
ncbi:MAG TPA: amylo-alpha-1,6-glucosidase [Vicinamibacteria bacterium]|jgi:predicted glycogen debranching enzyme